MGIQRQLSSLACELRVIQAKNIEFIKTTGNLFVRYHLSAGGNKSIRLNTREISTKSDHIWNESISLECNGTDSFLQETVVFELRWRNTVPVFGRIGDHNFWAGQRFHGKKCSSRQTWNWTGIKVGIQAEVGMEKRRQRRAKKWDECGCEDGHGYDCSHSYYDIFALAAVLEAF
ncbi:hypothetical protein M0R45_000673 [Rubus argutus]|uniref:C2 domain-containing protein n=1 Tax=Rubus argutus TaxID=59490 RepID=A0AAW1VNL2_RUBAR